MKSIWKINYDDLLDIGKISDVYNTIRLNTSHKEKLVKFEMFLSSNFMAIFNILKSKKYIHGTYNIFLITDPKCRVIMSESMYDKIINHLVSKYVLFPLIEPRLIESNVATRVNKGTKAAIAYMKRYINILKENHDKVYALKCDIHKYFYSIDHDILSNKLDEIIEDKEVLKLVNVVINSTNYAYVNERINFEVLKQKDRIGKLNIPDYDKKIKYQELDKIPRYISGKGLPIGNMTSQIMAVFYLNDLDHYIKEKLHIKYYIRYMDDMILLHHDRDYLKYCLKEINLRLEKLKLKLNNKTQIYELHHGIPFVGYKFKLQDKKLFTLMSSQTKRRIKRKLRKCSNNRLKRKEVVKGYNGYLMNADTGYFRYIVCK